MKWETVKLTGNVKSKGKPYASVGFSRISLSAAACELIENHQSIQYVEFCKASGSTWVGLRLLKEPTADALKVSRKKDSNGKYVTGMDITSKAMIENMFGLIGSAKKVTRFNVKKDEDTDNILIVYSE